MSSIFIDRAENIRIFSQLSGDALTTKDIVCPPAIVKKYWIDFGDFNDKRLSDRPLR
ncbi:hypothetical protein IQ272_01210 [Chroococcidiopsidales cyanobacterium LEGE 13417]|uniref:hypothetical protein n=1 Tax=Chroococcidiopsis sp. CCALA 051 TaxID=869949 RepID=UPI001304A2C7|nr:hypothetical protein [Chroococcidiopsis sp. CCALA 051]MBE9014790.1 hypothetical protein [Chroococcidiopsidales cyanobacterium LEGE 13417]